MESNTLRLFPDITRSDLSDHSPQRPAFPDPYLSWLRMLAFGAAVATGAYFLSGGWEFAQLAGRTQGVPSRRTMSSAFPYVALGTMACKWMGIWALTSLSPLSQTASESTALHALSRWRRILLRLVVTASFLLLALRLWGVIGDGLRPAFGSLTFTLVTQSAEAIETILLWLHLRALATGMGINRLRGRSLVVLIGRGGTITFLFVVPLVLVVIGYPLQLSWDFVNLRFCVAILWDAIAVLVLIQFAAAFLRLIERQHI